MQSENLIAVIRRHGAKAVDNTTDLPPSPDGYKKNDGSLDGKEDGEEGDEFRWRREHVAGAKDDGPDDLKAALKGVLQLLSVE
jgi:hypothetical protein